MPTREALAVMSPSQHVIDLAALAGTCDASAGSGAGAACSRARAHGAARLSAALGAARLACFPTDTVYGVGGLCRPAVLEALWQTKGRDPGKPLQVVFSSLPVLFAALDPEPALAAALRRLLPGAVTAVVPSPHGFHGPPPGRDRDGAPTLGVRVPAWPRRVLPMSWLASPLVASSANPAGRPAPRRLDDVDPELRAACDLLLDGGEVGAETGGLPSTVIDLTQLVADGTWRILRPGAVSAASVERALGPSSGASRRTGAAEPAAGM
jgi:L-threonylcarbamoyladenylate synthase